MHAIRTITIVGGGTAGWLAACYLQRRLGDGMGVHIRLIESKEIGIIGVGEATVPTLRYTLAAIGLPESALFTGADATLKNGIRFHGWRNGGAAVEDRFDHPFDFLPPIDDLQTFHHWLNLWQRGATTAAMSDACVVQTALFDAMCSPKRMDSPDYQAPVAYAYHLDAVKLAGVLQQTAVSRGVAHVIGDVVNVQHDDAGITAVQLADGSRHAADFFIDCTGFRALLIGKTLGVPWNSFNEWLPCDRAVACPVAYDSPDAPIRSYTTSTAQASGWIWDIGLQSRRGTGYVYASAYCSDDEAVATLRRYHGNDRALAEPRLLRMRVGHQVRAWEKNCLAVGLAGGFIEPLESTGIYLIEHALEQFVAQFVQGESAADITPRRDKYNASIADLYANLRDFIVAHYALSQRCDTPFWRACTAAAAIPQSLAELLAVWEHKIPTTDDLAGRLSLFGPNSWFCILAGQHRVPARGQTADIPAELSAQVLERVRTIRQAAVQQSPTLRDFVRKKKGAATVR